MKLGMYGLGRMGGNMAVRLARHGHEVVLLNRTRSVSDKVQAEAPKSSIAENLEDLVAKLPSPKIIWVMLPAGEVTEKAIEALGNVLNKGDIVIDGGNTFYKDDMRRAQYLDAKNIHYVDVGTSGGVWGLERGYCMMYGGNQEAVDHIDPILESLAPGIGDIPRTQGRGSNLNPRAEKGYLHCGPAGSGHFVKMVHNGIEYGMMQAYAEGFDIMRMKGSDRLPENQRFNLNMADIAEVWRRGSVIPSWLLDLCAGALANDGDLSQFKGDVADTGEGRWTVEAAIEEAVPAPVITSALFTRFRSRSGNTYAEKILSAMRFGFGGHVEKK
ncbi:6-phosphogluconate dehydrogenase, NAD(+)-dependent, decarboxylating [Commensalibacter sp. Nvir]|uniref:phosphogluconate dehydrogenase (NAD(+)-dependent, decarboxylating) n=1 Tax=Commensalibacter sp. Nvir TaxID=3069817 RepID=UPI002D5F1F66|nr:6-phosphogluconate dehydrogenase, NAD(+)-dependent, decarboxylating [Commensalibacter sp. Nvir]